MHTTKAAPDPVVLAHLAYVETRTACCEMCGRERATEYEAHDRRCMCAGCVWYRAAVNALAERGLS